MSLMASFALSAHIQATTPESVSGEASTIHGPSGAARDLAEKLVKDYFSTRVDYSRRAVGFMITRISEGTRDSNFSFEAIDTQTRESFYGAIRPQIILTRQSPAKYQASLKPERFDTDQRIFEVYDQSRQLLYQLKGRRTKSALKE